MRIPFRTVFKLTGAAVGLLLIAGIGAPYLTADRYGQRLRASLERALGRQVELGTVRFSVFKRGFSVDTVIIHEDPSIGIEPVAYIERDGSFEVVPGIWSLLGGRFVIASIRMENASINLTKSGPASEWGRWNFASLVNRSTIRIAPAIHVRNSRIHFKFGDTKSVFYLTETDLDISPSGAGGRDWRIVCSAKPARTDRPQQGLGSFTLKGHWYSALERADLDLQVDRTGLGEVTALLSGQEGGVHGTLSSRLHLAGPLNNIGITGRLGIEDVHRWDLLPTSGSGWPIDIRGRVDLIAQQIELHSSTAGNAPLPLAVHFRATDYLTQPHWAVAANWNRFPVAPIMELARHMGMQFPPNLQLGGSMDGAIGYSGQGSFQGELAFHDAALTIPGSPPVRFEQAQLVFDHGHARLAPALVKTADQDQARIEADYALDDETLDLTISAVAMRVASFRAQVALGAVPWLEQIRSGQWSGELHYHRDPAKRGWTGGLELSDAQIQVPGLADPLHISSARAQIDGARVVLDRIEAQAGTVAFTGEYRYEPGVPRPHKLRLRVREMDAADLEAELMPTLRRSSNLIARALGSGLVPGWLREREVEGTLQIDDLLLAGWRLENVRARLLWDVARVQLAGIQAWLHQTKPDRAAITGELEIALRGPRPSYQLTAKVRGVAWQSGRLDAEGTLETFGTGAQLLTNLTSEGAFLGTSVDLGTFAPLRGVSGAYNLAWPQGIPRLRLTSLNLRTEDETYTGQGATQPDGRLVILLTNGTKEMRMSGSLAKLRVDEAVKQ
jgi:hypothetical protein